jgi:hypothetical protein
MVPPFIESPRLVIGGYYVTNHICGNKNWTCDKPHMFIV